MSDDAVAEGAPLALPHQRSHGAPISLAAALGVAVLAAAFMSVVLYALTSFGVAVEILIRDPAAQIGFWPFYGFLSHMGVFAMGAAGVVCLFAGAYGARSRSLLAGVGVLSLMLAADDFFMLHDSFWLHRGISETVVYAAYVLFGVVIFAPRWRAFTGMDSAALWLAVALLGASVLSDAAMAYSRTELLIEDGLKFVGMWVWFAYWTTYAGASVRGA